MDRTIAAPASRNSPCPCGSGLRYKDCHGALGGGRSAISAAPAAEHARSTYRAPGSEWAHLDAAARDACGVLMEAALKHQTARRLDEAARNYRDVLAQAPDTHDALHMLGVIELAREDLDEAERLIRAALALRPTYAAIEHNLQLVNDARIAKIREQPEHLAERALPILAELALAGPAPSVGLTRSRSAAASEVHLIGRVGGDDDDAWLLRRVCEVLGPKRTLLWTCDADIEREIAGLRATRIDGATGAVPRGGVHVYVGLDFECASWMERADADRVIAIAIGAAPTVCLDQLRAIARDGARHVELALLSPAMAARFGRGHRVVMPPIVLDIPTEPVGAAHVYGEWTIQEPPPWPVGVSGQSRRNVVEPADVAFVKSIAVLAGRLHLHDPGRLRYTLGGDRNVRFFTRRAQRFETFLASLRCYVHRVDAWWDEGAGRELFAAMVLGLPVLCPRGSCYADSIEDGVDGLLYESADEALARLTELRRAPAFAAAIGRAARVKAQRLFEPAAIASAWRELVRGDVQSNLWSADVTLALAPAQRIAS